MKKKIGIALLVIIPFISIVAIIMFRGAVSPTNEEILKDLRDINCYETKVEYIIKNDKGIERENTTQYYLKDNGARIDFDEGVSKIYKEDGITVKDNVSNSEYTVDNSMDIVHSLAFLNKILSCPVINDSLKEGQEEWGETIYIQMDVELFFNNEHLDTARIFIDKNQKVPIGIIVYDKNGNDSVRIIYDQFKSLKEIDQNLLM